MQDCDAVKIPLDPMCMLSKDDGPSMDSDKVKMANKPYHKLIGTLTWILTLRNSTPIQAKPTGKPTKLS